MTQEIRRRNIALSYIVRSVQFCLLLCLALAVLCPAGTAHAAQVSLWKGENTTTDSTGGHNGRLISKVALAAENGATSASCDSGTITAVNLFYGEGTKWRVCGTGTSCASGGVGSASCTTNNFTNTYCGGDPSLDVVKQGRLEILCTGGAQYDAGASGQAFNFDGSARSLVVPDAEVLSGLSAYNVTNTHTITLWVKADDYPASGYVNYLVNKWVNGGVEDKALLLNPDGTVTFRLVRPGGSADSVTTVTPLTKGVWTHIAATYANDWIQIYINGERNAIVSSSGDISDSYGRLYLGDNPERLLSGGLSKPFKGQLDEVAWYNFVLNTNEVRTVSGLPVSNVYIPAKTGMALNTMAVSDPVAITPSSSYPASMTITGGEYAFSSDNYQTWTSAATLIPPGVPITLKVRRMSSGSYSTTTTATLSIGGNSATFSVSTIPPPVLYTIPGGVESGRCDSWGTACKLRYALISSIADINQEIWVAAGTYTPTAGTDRSATFQLKSGVAIYGGFTGNEDSRNARDITANVTILSGDIGTVGDSSDNSYHVVTGITGAILDGVTVSGGNANGDSFAATGGGMYNNNASPTVTNVTFSGNAAIIGGGIYNIDSSPTITNVTLSGNGANIFGGGMYNSSSSPAITNVTFIGNSATSGGGGGMYNENSSPTITNVTFSGNTAPGGTGGGMSNNSASSPNLTNVTISGNSAQNGGGMYSSWYSNPVLTNVTVSGNSVPSGGKAGGLFIDLYSSSAITNCILWGNSDGDDGNLVINSGSSATLTDSVVAGGCRDGSTCTGLITTDPLLAPLGNYGGPSTGSGQATKTIALLPGSPAINTGNAAFCPTTDQRGKSRLGTCDMGAFESQGYTLTTTGGDEQSAATNSPFANPLQVTLSESGGSPLSGAVITFSAPASGASATISGSPAVTDSLGRASVSATANGTAGPYSVTASAGGGVNASFSLTNLPTVSFFVDGVLWQSQIVSYNATATVLNPVPVKSGNAFAGWYSDEALTTLFNFATPITGNTTLYAKWTQPELSISTATFPAGGNYSYYSTTLTADGGSGPYSFSSSDPLPPGITLSLAGVISGTPTVVGSTTFTVHLTDSFNNTASRSFTLEIKRTRLYAVQGGLNSGQCESWATACELRYALTSSNPDSNQEIWVKAGTYAPALNSTNRVTTFQLKSGVAIYGGFTGGETSRDQRNFAANVTILSGKIRTFSPAVYSYHVVTGADGAILDGVTITDGHADGSLERANGGGMYNYSGSPTITNVTFSGNTASGSGGGMYNGGSPTITNVTFSGNGANVFGGGMHSIGSPIITNAAFSGNTAAYGGGMCSGDITITNATFSGNTASDSGGGMYSSGSPTITNATFSGNTASYSGGGMYGNGSPAITNATFSGNTAPNGSGVYADNYSIYDIRNSILWGDGVDVIIDGTGTITVSESVLQGGCPAGAACSNIISANPLLGALGSYDGPTKTIPLLPGSAAIKAATSNCPATDQRGKPRSSGSGPCDMGAFESQGFTLAKTGGDGQITAPNTAFASPLQVTLSETGGSPLSGAVITFSAPASGASATISGSPATTDSLGRASVSATANCSGGAYSVTASAGGGVNAGFSLTNLPTVSFFVDGALWQSQILSYNSTATVPNPAPVKSSNSFAGWYSDQTLTTLFNFTTPITGNTTLYAKWSQPALNISTSPTLTVGLKDKYYSTTLTADGGSGPYSFSTSDPLPTGITLSPAGVVSGTPTVYGSFPFTVHLTDSFNNTASKSFTLDIIPAVLHATQSGLESGRCESWGTACKLRYALTSSIADSNQEIWVAAGTYTPTAATDRTATFQLKSGVAVYGGFVGNEVSRNARNSAANVTILSGDIGTVGDSSDNAYHVVTGITGATLDGVTVSGGNANGDSFAATGGGMYNENSSPTITNVTFSGNTAINGGGICNVVGSNPTITNATFSGNTATDNGGGMYNNSGCSPVLTNVTFSGNSASIGGGVYNHWYSGPTIRNSILWDNSGGEIINSDYTSSPTVIDSVVQGGYAGGTNIIDIAPLLVPLGSYGGSSQTFALLPGSAAIKVATSNCPASDQRGKPRSSGSGPCDMGAFESQGFALTKTGDNQSTAINTAFTNSLQVTLSETGGSPLPGAVITFSAPASGASADISGSPATTDSLGRASVSATANGSGGAYSVTIGAGGGVSTSFSLTNLLAVTFSVDGALWQSQIVPYNSTATVPNPVPVKSGNAFAGWYSDQALTTLFNFATPITGSITLYAKWTQPALSISTATLPSGTIVNYYNTPLTADGGSGPYSFSTGDPLPAGITLSPAGVVSGTPTVYGSFPFTVHLTDSFNNSASKSFTLDIIPAVLHAKMRGLESGLCESWDTACELRYALARAVSGQEIWAAAGYYTPTAGTDCTATFQLKSGVAVYGGFTGNEDSRNARNIAVNATILSGDTGGGKSFHVVTGANGATLDGVTIRDGYANGASPDDSGGGMYNNSCSSSLIITNVIFNYNWATNGGGIYNSSSFPTITNVTFSGNGATNKGGGMYNSSSSPTIKNVTFSGNQANFGGGMYNNSSSSPTITNVTISGNSATGNGRGMYLENSSSMTVRNSILWGDTGVGSEIYVPFGSRGFIGVTNSFIQDGCPQRVTCTPSYSVIDSDPLLGALGNYGGSTQTIPLLPGSPAIDAGNDIFCPATDQRGMSRFGTCDIGAYEWQGFTLAVAISGADGNKVESTSPDQQINCIKGSIIGCSANYASGATVLLKPTATSGSVFSAWSDAATGAADPLSITMYGNKNLTATFELAPLVKNKTFGNKPYATLADALNDPARTAVSGDELLLLGTSFSGAVSLGKGIILSGGWNATYDANDSLTTTLSDGLTVSTGDSTVANITVGVKLTVKGGSLRVNGVTVHQ